MGQLVEHCLENSPAVYRLVFAEYFLYKPPVEHCGDDVIHHLSDGAVKQTNQTKCVQLALFARSFSTI